MSIPYKKWDQGGWWTKRSRDAIRHDRSNSKFTRYALHRDDQVLHPYVEKLLFYLMDARYIWENDRLATYLFGVTDKDSSATVCVENFQPYFYVGIPSDWSRYATEMAMKPLEKRSGAEVLQAMCELLYDYIAAFIKEQPGMTKDYSDPVIPRAPGQLLIERRDGFGYNGDELVGLMKITLTHPRVVPKIRELLWHPFGLLDNHCGVCNQEFTIQDRVSNHESKGKNRVVLHKNGSHMCACHLKCMRRWGADLRARGELNEAYYTCCPRCRMDTYKPEIMNAEFKDQKWTELGPIYKEKKKKGQKKIHGQRKQRVSQLEKLIKRAEARNKAARNVEERGDDTESSDDEGFDIPNESSSDSGTSDEEEEEESEDDGDFVNEIATSLQPDSEWDNAEDGSFRQPSVVKSWFPDFANIWRSKNHYLDPLPSPLPTEVPDIITRELEKQYDAKYRLPPRFSVYEANVDFVIRLMVDVGIRPNSWIELSPGSYQEVPRENRFTENHLEVATTPDGISSVPDDNPITKKPPPLVNMAFDGEMHGDHSQVPFGGNPQFPSPGVPECDILQWSTIMWREDNPSMFHRYIFVMKHLSCHKEYGDLKPDENGKIPEIDRHFKYPCEEHINPDSYNDPGKTLVFEYTNQREMLREMCEFHSVTRPDLITGHNINGFDIPYFVERCRVMGVAEGRNFMSRCPTIDTVWRKGSKRGRAIVTIDIAGVTVMDFLHHVQEDKSWGLHTLQMVAKNILGSQKVDMPYQFIDIHYKSAKGRYTIALYCVWDSEIIVRACIKDKSIGQRSRLGHMTGTSIQTGIQRGTQHRVFSGILHYTRRYSQEIQGVETALPTFQPKVKRESKRAKYRGAVVLKPRVGYYGEKFLFKNETLAQEIEARKDDIAGIASKRLNELREESKRDGVEFARRIVKEYANSRTGRGRDLPWQSGAMTTYEMLEQVKRIDTDSITTEIGEHLFDAIETAVMDGSFFAEILDAALHQRDLPAPWNLIITVLDYASLYPSIMMEHNLCISTLAHPIMLKKHGISMDDVFQTPDYRFEGDEIFKDVNAKNPCFVKENIRRGIVPSYERYLKALRDEVKGMMKKVFEQIDGIKKQLNDPNLAPHVKKQLKDSLDPLYYELDRLDLFQLVIKILMNSIYGFYGAAESKFPSQAMAWTITTVGQYAAMVARSIVHKTVTRDNGFESQAEVMYGDTDSVMYLLWGMEQMLHKNYSVMIGFEMSRKIAEVFEVLRTELEKVCKEMHSFSKKRYVMQKIETNGKCTTEEKGIQPKRRDSTWMQKHLSTVITNFKNLGDPKSAIKYYCDAMASIALGEVPHGFLTVTGSFKKPITECGKNKIPIVLPAMVGLKQCYRTKVVIPPGERVSFLVADRSNVSTYDWGEVREWMRENKQDVSKDPKSVTMQAESIEYALQNRIGYDVEYYIDKVRKSIAPLILCFIEEGETKAEKQNILERMWRNNPDLPPHLRKFKKIGARNIDVTSVNEKRETRRVVMGGKVASNTIYNTVGLVVNKRCCVCSEIIPKPAAPRTKRKHSELEMTEDVTTHPGHPSFWISDDHTTPDGKMHYASGALSVAYAPSDRPLNEDAKLHVCDTCRPKAKLAQEFLVKNRDADLKKMLDVWSQCSSCTAIDVGPQAILECQSTACLNWSIRAGAASRFQGSQTAMLVNSW
jgi:DNA polymerase elongation subunit (family B)